jgi:hypothetical protein
VSTDDLTASLGQEDKQDKRKRGRLAVAFGAFPFGPIIAGLLGVCIGIFIVWAAVVHDPFGGEPLALVSTEGTPPSPRDGATPAAHAPEAVAPEPAEKHAAAAPPATPEAPSKTVTIIDGTSGQRQEVTIPSGEAAKPLIDQKLLETTRHGTVPRVGVDGTRVSAAYARPLSPTAQKSGAVRIALVVGGLGIGASSTNEALSRLPGVVTLAFAPYGSDLDKLVGRARAEGHEVLLQIPMEPFDYPDNDPGPQTLLTSLAPEQNIDRMHWLMSRFQGYVGLASFMGARFTASEQALAPVLREAAKRGLLYVDDGASTRSVAGQIAGSQNLPFAKTDIVIDATPTPTEIDHALARLELAARERGTAVGFATALPATVSRIAAWAKKVEGRGFLLVPITMIAVKAKSS